MALALGEDFVWSWLPAWGHSGGVLLGIKDDKLEVELWMHGEFYIGATIRNKMDNFRWNIFVFMVMSFLLASWRS